MASEMKGLLGSYDRVLDEKARLIVPPELRKRLTGAVIVTKWYDNSLALMTEEDYEAFADGLNQQGTFDPSTRSVRREFFGSAGSIVIDQQGRMSIPEWLLEGFLDNPNTEEGRRLVVVGDWTRVLIFPAGHYKRMAKSDDVGLDKALTDVERRAHTEKERQRSGLRGGESAEGADLQRAERDGGSSDLARPQGD